MIPGTITAFKAWAALVGSIVTALVAADGVIPVTGTWHVVFAVITAVVTAVTTYQVPYIAYDDDGTEEE